MDAGLARGSIDALTIRLFLAKTDWPIVDAPEVPIGSSADAGVLLDPGERELLTVAQTLPKVLLLIDDEAARTEARRLGLSVRGTLGILAQARRTGC